MKVIFHLNGAVLTQIEYNIKDDGEGPGLLDHILHPTHQTQNIYFDDPVSPGSVDLLIKCVAWINKEDQIPTFWSEKTSRLFKLLVIFHRLDIHGMFIQGVPKKPIFRINLVSLVQFSYFWTLYRGS